MFMKKLLFILFGSLILTTTLSFSQSSQLDKKRGFKDFTLGDPYTKWSSSLSFLNSDNGVSYYKYTGYCCNEVFNYRLSEIRLGFAENKLQIIYLITENQIKDRNEWLSYQYSYLKSNLNSIFGESSGDMPAEKKGNVMCTWKGNNTFLILEYQYMGVKGNSEKAWSEDRCTIMFALKPRQNTGF